MTLKETIEIERIDGFKVRYMVQIEGIGKPLVLLHGFTGSGTAWDEVAPILAKSFTVIRPDLMGHGETDAPHDPNLYNAYTCSGDIVRLCKTLGYEQFALHGYSMGGRLALYLAQHFPQQVRALSLESASPGLRTPEERAARVSSDDSLAAFILSRGVTAFIEEWEKLPLFIGLNRITPEKQAALRQMRLTQRPLGLANSLRGMGTGAQQSLWARLGDYTGAALILTGSEDTKFCAIGDEMKKSMPGAERVNIPNAGHTIHLEQPEAWLNTIGDFFKRNV
jgi:2-succinyl-6-hydroxy-2,4-cyclohexadiene-1-carboxylate synthase